MSDNKTTMSGSSRLWEKGIRKFIENTIDPFFIIDHRGSFAEVNTAYCNLVGYTREELLSMSLSDIDTLENPKDIRKYAGEVFADGKLRLLTSHRRSDGQFIDVEIISTTFNHNDTNYFFVSVHNIERRKENILSDLTKDSLLELYLKNVTRKEYLNEVVELLQGWSGCKNVGIRLVNDRGYLPYESHVGFDIDFIKSENISPIESKHCSCTRIVTGSPASHERSIMTPEGSVFCNNIDEYYQSLPPEARNGNHETCRTAGFKSVAIIPCSHQGRTLGVIHLADDRENRVPIRVVNFIQSIAPLVGEAIYKFNIEVEIKRTHDTRLIINAILLRALDPVPLEEVLDFSLERIAGLSWLDGLLGCAVFLQDDPGDSLTLKAQYKIPVGRLVDFTNMPADTDIFRSAWKNKKTQLERCDNESAVDRCPYPLPHYRFATPILDGRHLLGMMLIFMSDEYFQRGNEELYLDSIAGALAGIILRKKSEQALELERHKLNNILESMNDGVIIINQQCDIEFTNQIMDRDFGPPGGLKCHEYLHCDTGQCSWCFAPQVTAGKPQRRQWHCPVNEKSYDVYSTIINNADHSVSMVEFFHDITKLRRSEEQIVHQANLLSKVNDAIIAFDDRFVLTFWNSAAETIYGWAAEEVMGRSVIDLLQPRYENEDGSAAVDLMNIPENFRVEMVHRTKKGSNLHIEATGIKLRNANGDMTGYVTVNRDITQRKRDEADMIKLSLAVEQGSDWVIITDRNGTIEYSNEIVEKITGYTKEEIIGSNPSILKSGLHDTAFYRNLWEIILSGNSFRSLFINRRKDGKLFYIDMSITPLKNSRGEITNFVASGKDITHQKHMEDQLVMLVHFDMLTGLPNRTLFIDRFNQALLRGEYSKRLIAVLIVDIDRFKLLNDSLGAEIGDEIIKSIAARIKATIREGDILARLGSDEFGLALIDVAQKEDFIIIVDKMMMNLSQPLLIKGHEIVVTVSIGISIYPSDGDNADRILQNADIAISKAKRLGRNNYQFFTSDMNLRASEFVMIEKHLFSALNKGEFNLLFQPYYTSNTREIVGMEALLRWNNQTLGMSLPETFIPILEETGMIIPVGVWIIRSVCEQINEWQEKGFAPVPVSVNLSPIQFRQSDLAENMEKIVREYSIDPRLITFELTENILMQDQDYASRVLDKLRDAGFSISIDDFGTGYSSLSYVKRFPFNFLKIDKSFIKDINTDPDSGSIVTTIITLSHNLNLKAIAEGVETEEQYNILRILKCDYMQGFYLSVPLPGPDIESLMAKQESL